MKQEKVLLNVEETASYLNLGMTKTRELMKENEKILVIEIMHISYYWINGYLHRLKNKSRVQKENSHICFIIVEMIHCECRR